VVGQAVPPVFFGFRATSANQSLECYAASAIYEWEVPLDIAGLTTKLTLDKAGRVVIPKPLRDELNLGPGDALQLETEGEQITLRPVRGAIPRPRP
jgi:AbrB family looped-hinge helix DNA binding protein